MNDKPDVIGRAVGIVLTKKEVHGLVTAVYQIDGTGEWYITVTTVAGQYQRPTHAARLLS